MTIRDYLKSRIRIFYATVVAGWLICAGSMFFLGTGKVCRPGCASHAPPPTVFLGFPIFFGAIIWMTFFVKCPRCSGRLGTLAATTSMRGFLSRPINFCPFCGVSLDEPYDPKVAK